MSGSYRLFGILAAVCLTSVTSIDFTLSRNQIELGNTIDTYWTMNCSMTDSNVNSVLFINIFRESMNADETWQHIASVTAQGTSLGSLPSDLNDNNVDADGIIDSTTPTNSKLGVSMTSASLSCDDDRKYRCELSYLLPSLQTMEQALNATLTVSAPASVPVLSDAESDEGSASNPKVMAVWMLLQLQCEANIGTDSSRTISWQKSSETSNALICYNGNVDDGTAEVDNSGGTSNSCTYKRTSTMIYNTTINDANRDDQYPLRFSCYVGSTSDNDPLFYVDVSDVPENDEKLQSQSNTFVEGFASGFGTCLLSVLLVLSVLFLYRRKRQTHAGQAKTLHGKDEHFYENSTSADVLRLQADHSEGQGQENMLQMTGLDDNNTHEDMRQTLDEGGSATDIEIPSSSNGDQQYYTSLTIEQGEHVYKDLSST